MNHVSLFIVCFPIIDLFKNVNSQNGTIAVPEQLNFDTIAEALIIALGVKRDSNDTRLNELKDKLRKISNYVVDREKYSMLLMNVTSKTKLNETSFYKALDEDDKFKFLSEKEPKNLYLKMKEKMNRDDIMGMLALKGDNEKLIKIARKVMDIDYFGEDQETLDAIIDKVIGEEPRDDHKFNAKASRYWDPQGELKDRQEYHRHDGRRIYKGERSTIRYYPFMVSVHVMGKFWCGGSLYHHDLVLTSAACLQLMHNNRFFRENPRVLQVRVGSNHSRIGGELIDALEVYFHPGYNPRTLRNNLAIIRLRHHLMFTYHRIPKVIEISTNPGTVAPTAEVLLLGWGVTKMTQKMSFEPVYLQRKFLPVYPNTFCKEVYGDKFITQTMFCAGTFTTGEGACDHDAGGPAILSGKLVGIISFGPSICGYPNAPTVFTLVGAFADWIETVNETMPDYYRARVKTTTSTRKPLYDYLFNKYPPEQYSPPVELSIAVTEDTMAPATEATETTPEPIALRMKGDKLSDDDSWGD